LSVEEEASEAPNPPGKADGIVGELFLRHRGQRRIL
jgi:hypothetical protein